MIDTAGVKTASSSQEDQLKEGEGTRPSRTSPGGGEANNAGTRPMFTTGSSAWSIQSMTETNTKKVKRYIEEKVEVLVHLSTSLI